mgnify:CR=1 FL=1
MKMNRQNPGGEGQMTKSMKGCEQYMKKGQGDLKPYGLTTKYSAQERGLEGKTKGGHVRSTAHAKTSFTGSTVTGTFPDAD